MIQLNVEKRRLVIPSNLHGVMYDDIRTIEIGLHGLVREALEAEYGEDHWWRKGVSLPIRQKCVARREEDNDPANDPVSTCQNRPIVPSGPVQRF